MAEKKKPRPGLVQITLIVKQLFGTTPTYCTWCGKKVTFKMIRADSSYTKLCKCGCTLVQYHKPDQFHDTMFYTQKFIPAKKFDPEHKNKDEFEKQGFQKTKKDNGAAVYAK